MAKCPKCGAIWLWDWCNDCYVDETGKEYPLTELKTQDQQINVWSCKCSNVNGAAQNGEVCDNWNDIDWELGEHSWPEGQKMSQDEKDKLFQKAKELDKKWQKNQCE